MTQNEIILVAAFAITIYFALRWRIQLRDVNKKFEKIIDVDSEREKIVKEIETLKIDADSEQDKIVKEIETLKSERQNFQNEFKDKKNKLVQKYEEANQKYKSLLREINLLEENLEMMDCGVYKPHFDFTDSEQYRRQLENLRDREKILIKDDRAVRCSTEWTVGGSKIEGKKMTKQTHKLMLRAFNGECDAALAKVRWDNIQKMEERVRKAVEAINKSAEVNQSHITQEYLALKIDELRLTYELQEKIKQEKDEQKKIQEEMREEEKARREMEKAKIEAEKEELRYQKALDKAREEVAKAKGEKLDELNQKIALLESELTKAHEQKERAVSQAQLTKSGHVYIISNIGSFGESVYKIGMTRRLEPMDRVKELGDASVPFEFDVHAMIYSENAPELERRLQNEFAGRRLNLVNPRKEFFNVSLDEIESWSAKEKFPIQLSKIAEARAYRESMAIREKGDAEKVGHEIEKQHEKEEKLFDEEDEE